MDNRCRLRSSIAVDLDRKAEREQRCVDAELNGGEERKNNAERY